MGNWSPGTSARREYERLHADYEATLLRERRFIGSLLLKLQDDPLRTRAWERGASGERIVGARLDKLDGIAVLHDRRIPGTRTDIDHIAIGPGGVYVIDAKLYGGMVRHRRADHLRRDRRVSIEGDERAKLVARMRTQVSAITRALVETPIPVTAAICFVDAEWPEPARPFTLDGIWVGWPEVLPDLVTRPGLLDDHAMATAGGLLDSRLPPA